MSSVSPIGCNTNIKYDLGSIDGIPETCTYKQEEEILLKALEDPDADQRYAAVRRLITFGYSDHLLEKALEIFPQEKDIAVISALAELFTTHQIKEAVPYLIEKLKQPEIQIACVIALARIGDPSAIPALQEAFKNNPSKITAVALLKLGDPDPYFQNFAEQDLELFGEADNFLVYDVPFWWMLFGGSINVGLFVVPGYSPSPNMEPPDHTGGKTMPVGGNLKFPSHKESTAASELKPGAKENLLRMLDLFAKNKDGAIIPFLFATLKYPPNPIPKEKLISVFHQTVSPEYLPVILNEIKNNPPSTTAAMILNYLQEQILKGNFTAAQKEEIVKTITGLLEDAKLKNRAVKFLAEIGERSIVPYLLSAIKDHTYCQVEIGALAKLESSPGEFESIFIAVFNGNEYSDGSKTAAAIALALQGKRDGIDLLFEKLYGLSASTYLSKPGSNILTAEAEQTLSLLNAISKIIQPEDIEHLNAFIESGASRAIMIGLELSKMTRDPEIIPLILPKLKEENINLSNLSTGGMSEETINNIKLEIRFNALLTLAVVREFDDPETLEIIKKEVEFWQSHLDMTESPLYFAVKEKLSILEDYIEKSELAIEMEESGIAPESKPKLKTHVFKF